MNIFRSKQMGFYVPTLILFINNLRHYRLTLPNIEYPYLQNIIKRIHPYHNISTNTALILIFTVILNLLMFCWKHAIINISILQIFSIILRIQIQFIKNNLLASISFSGIELTIPMILGIERLDIYLNY